MKQHCQRGATDEAFLHLSGTSGMLTGISVAITMHKRMQVWSRAVNNGNLLLLQQCYHHQSTSYQMNLAS
jgi:hypothetical protein